MMMRFHPGLAIGHTYPTPESAAHHSSTEHDNYDLDDPSVAPGNADSEVLESESAADSDASMDSMDGGREDEVDPHQIDQEVSGDEENIDDDEFLARHEMYE